MYIWLSLSGVSRNTQASSEADIYTEAQKYFIIKIFVQDRRKLRRLNVLILLEFYCL